VPSTTWQIWRFIADIFHGLGKITARHLTNLVQLAGHQFYDAVVDSSEGSPRAVFPVGYMAKRVKFRPEWLDARNVEDIYSVSRCLSEDFADYWQYSQHNLSGFFDAPGIIVRLATDNSIDLSGTSLFFYETHELEFEEPGGTWKSFHPTNSLMNQIVSPQKTILEGFDIVTINGTGGVECSPLSCDSLAREIDTNRHCLLTSLERAQELLSRGKLSDAAPGARRIFAVYSAQWP